MPPMRAQDSILLWQTHVNVCYKMYMLHSGNVVVWRACHVKIRKRAMQDLLETVVARWVPPAVVCKSDSNRLLLASTNTVLFVQFLKSI
jgi:hypothetical protein